MDPIFWEPAWGVIWRGDTIVVIICYYTYQEIEWYTMMRENEKRFETTHQSASVGIGIIIITIAVDETLPVILWRSHLTDDAVNFRGCRSFLYWCCHPGVHRMIESKRSQTNSFCCIQMVGAFAHCKLLKTYPCHLTSCFPTGAEIARQNDAKSAVHPRSRNRSEQISGAHLQQQSSLRKACGS